MIKANFPADNNDAGSASVAAMVPGKISAMEWRFVDNRQVYLYTLTNKQGVQGLISNYGATVTSWIIPGTHGEKKYRTWLWLPGRLFFNRSHL